MLSCLNRHRQHHHVETTAGKHIQPGFDVLLDHIHTAMRASQHLSIVDFDAIAAAALGMLQMIEKRAVTAPQVKHPRAGCDPVGNGSKIGPQAVMIESTAGQIHIASPAAIRSK